MAGPDNVGVGNWNIMFTAISWLVLITFMPALELRASIPYGIFGTGLHWSAVFLICVAANIALAPLVWLFVNYVMHLFLKISMIKHVYDSVMTRSQKKVEPYVKKYGTLGLAVFIGIPLPGSGVYSGALGAYLLGFSFKNYFISSVLGVLIAGTVVLLVSLFGEGTWLLLIKRM